ncbi:hypothetical protein AWJ20_3974 [Sugiyamaella lignohabitans]|uniref:ELMO domain-containing protein n=1 Tax=Sugiyamaella lignohabitans TaxID=796027 RepID=A0A167C3G6_9ASCO|nr:uncharacterized protein AWJ20_3974 [Sugiyamaella lignohabitans]ANB11172.1 hypothetical protein AWJ20_3974 [Sugiyamaella lignohabitans]
MSILEILAWIVLAKRDKCEAGGSFLDRITFALALHFYKFCTFVDCLIHGLSRTEVLISRVREPQKTHVLKQLIWNVWAHSQLQDLQGEWSNEQELPLVGKTDNIDSSFVGLLTDVPQSIGLVYEDLLERAANPTTWSDGKDRYIEIYNSVFQATNEAEIDIEESVILSSGLRHRRKTGRALSANKTTEEAVPAPKPHNRGNLDWVALGFQGSDPATDFRGSGKFGEECFYRFCTVTNPKVVLRTIMLQSGSFNSGPVVLSKPWYSVALVSIHLSQFILTLIQRDTTRLAFYRGVLLSLSLESLNGANKLVDIEDCIYTLHSTLLTKFHKTWMEAVAKGDITSVMDTEPFLENFKTTMTEWLWLEHSWAVDPEDTYEILEFSE